MIKVIDGFTSITIAADQIPHLKSIWYTSARPPERALRTATGARVTVEFSRREALPPNTDIRVQYDIGENGALREILGIPQLTHTTAARSDVPSYHYRLSHWIPALSVMQFMRA